MSSITQQAWDALEYDPPFPPEEALHYLSEPWHFQNFTKYVLHLAEEKELGLTPEQLHAYLKGAVLALGPVSDYLNSEITKFLHQSFQFRPEIGDYRADKETPRELALRLCFVFRLSMGEAKDFLRKGCGSYPFNVRSAYESACYYCVLAGRPYETVLELLRRYEAAPAAAYPDSENTGTRRLASMLQGSDWESDEAFLQTFLIPNKAKFIEDSKTTIRTYQELRFELCQQIIDLRCERYVAGEGDPIFRQLKKGLQALAKYGLAFAGCEKALSDWSQAGQVLEEVKRLLRKKYKNCPGEARAHYEALLNNAVASNQLVKEILPYNPDTPLGSSLLANTTFMNCFPRRQYLTDFQKKPEDRTRSTKIRKAIILLFFMGRYFDCVHDEGSSVTSEEQFERFQEELNQHLNECGLSKLYIADPFDWLILKSARALLQPEPAEDNGPIDYFNEVIRLSFSQQDGNFD